MQKTKLGISAALLGAVVCFSGLFSGYLLVFLLTAYILLMEENVWLKKTAVKTVAVLMVFSLLSAVLGLIPDLISVISSIFNIFNGSFSIRILSSIISAARSILGFLETLLLLGLGFKALNQGTIKIPMIDKLVDKLLFRGQLATNKPMV